MAPPNEELAELRREWREIVLKDLSELKLLVKELSSQIVDVKLTFAQQHELIDLRLRISSLESFKAKIIGITLGANAIFALLAWVTIHFLNK